MTIYKCDLCGKEVTDRDQLITCYRDIKLNIFNGPTYTQNICEECYSTLQNTLETEEINIATKTRS